MCVRNDEGADKNRIDVVDYLVLWASQVNRDRRCNSETFRPWPFKKLLGASLSICRECAGRTSFLIETPTKWQSPNPVFLEAKTENNAAR
jgi:hypothetical protein